MSISVTIPMIINVEKMKKGDPDSKYVKTVKDKLADKLTDHAVLAVAILRSKPDMQIAELPRGLRAALAVLAGVEFEVKLSSVWVTFKVVNELRWYGNSEKLCIVEMKDGKDIRTHDFTI